MCDNVLYASPHIWRNEYNVNGAISIHSKAIINVFTRRLGVTCFCALSSYCFVLPTLVMGRLSASQIVICLSALSICECWVLALPSIIYKYDFLL